MKENHNEAEEEPGGRRLGEIGRQKGRTRESGGTESGATDDDRQTGGGRSMVEAKVAGSQLWRSNGPAVGARITFVMHMLCTGWKKGEIKEWFRREYLVRFRQVERYIRAARQRLVEEVAGSNRDQLIAESFGYYMSVLKDPNASQKDKNQARKQADELLGLNAPKKIAPTSPDGKNPYQAAVKQLSNEDLELLAKLKERSASIVSGASGCSAN